ncbi:MAG TPA: metallophosphoesterase [Syntrophorhabdales bacterium]|nr:metallophosphoesterase [Syntrophorhabdales bacterium]
MGEIRYVCLSDMHLGATNSLLTNLKIASTDTDPLKASPVMEQLVECLKTLIGVEQDVTLILNGDIVELALATDNEAYMAFERFIELTLKPGQQLFKRIIYIPGNHDHHLWELARETQYMEFVGTLQEGASGPRTSKDELPPSWHTTNLFVENDPRPVIPYTLNRLVRYTLDRLKRNYTSPKAGPPDKDDREDTDFPILTAYPNLALMKTGGQKCVIFHHGHFVESLYHLMTTIKNLVFSRGKPKHSILPNQIWDLEAENFAWIDFFWSTMGRSGDVGKDVGIFYEKMQDPGEFKKLLYNLAKNLIAEANQPCWAAWLEKKGMKRIISMVIDRIGTTENLQTEKVLSKDAEKGLRNYMNGPLREQIRTKLRNDKTPPDVTFVFAHTHKPFEEVKNFKEYTNQWVKVYNSGGWVVESVDPAPRHGGAVILIDEDLNVASLRMYNEDSNALNYAVKVEEALHPGEPSSPFCSDMRSLFSPSVDPWRKFSHDVAEAVQARAENLRAEIHTKANGRTKG